MHDLNYPKKCTKEATGVAENHFFPAHPDKIYIQLIVNNLSSNFSCLPISYYYLIRLK